jgi:hypothetical protein
MAVWYTQHDNGELTDGPRQVFGEGSDADILQRKLEGAQDKGWTVETGHHSFTASKTRGVEPRQCERRFWIE